MIQGTSKRLKFSKSPFRKFYPKTILSLAYMGKRKKKNKYNNFEIILTF